MKPAWRVDTHQPRNIYHRDVMVGVIVGAEAEAAYLAQVVVRIMNLLDEIDNRITPSMDTAEFAWMITRIMELLPVFPANQPAPPLSSAWPISSEDQS